MHPCGRLAVPEDRRATPAREIHSDYFDHLDRLDPTHRRPLRHPCQDLPSQRHKVAAASPPSLTGEVLVVVQEMGEPLNPSCSSPSLPGGASGGPGKSRANDSQKRKNHLDRVDPALPNTPPRQEIPSCLRVFVRNKSVPSCFDRFDRSDSDPFPLSALADSPCHIVTRPLSLPPLRLFAPRRARGLELVETAAKLRHPNTTNFTWIALIALIRHFGGIGSLTS